VALMAQRSTYRITLVVALLAAAAALLWWPAAGLPPYRAAGGDPLSWWQLALLSAAAELFVLHIQVRREAQAVSLSEIPQVVGLFLAAPVSFGVGRVLGVLLVCVLRRRQAPLKLAFNGVQVALESAIAVLVFHRVLDLVGDGTPARWAAAFAASAAVGTVSALSITAVVSLAEGALNPRELLSEPARGAVASVAVAVPGLIVVGLVEQSRWNALLAVLALAALVVGYRAYAVLSERHLSLERLYRFSQVVSDRPEVDEVLQTILDQATEVLRADHAEVLFLPGEAAQHAVRVAAQPGGRLSRTPCSLTDRGPWARAVATGDPVLIPRDSRDVPDRAFLTAEGLRDTIIVPLRGEAGLIGALLVGDRVGEVRTFDGDDVRLLETVANHASVALRNGQLVDRLRYEAAHDALTGLPNRTALSRHLQQVLHDRCSDHAAVLLLDLDGFKQVNDTLGHHRGDELLQQVAARLRAAAPPRAQVARLGGDEFAVVLPAVRDRTEAVDIARDLLTALVAPLPVGGIQLEVSASIGVAMAPEHADDVATLLRRADMAMYEAKNTGRGVVAVFDPVTTHQDTPAQLALAGELRRAIAGGELRLYVQPKADARTGQIVGVEALVRWQHPELGLIMPDEFIPIAERNGLIHGLTTAVLRGAIGILPGWERVGVRLSIAVNLSPRGLLGSELPAQVSALFAEHGTSPSLLTLELTESSMMTDPAGVAALMAELHQMGVKLSIDDFGTGYSSLSSLRKLPLDEIKIDKSFVMGLEENGDDQKIVRSIIDLGTNLGLAVVAEGVENSRIWQMLQRMGCTQVQGYYLTRPIPIEDFPAWLANYRQHNPALATAG
jgi:diguanylate cyclase (GGDEF)-like protein